MAEKNLHRGLFIPVEGLDGSGKSTLVQALHEQLESMGYPVVMTREPGATQVGHGIRSLLHSGVDNAQAEFLLFAADRALHMQQVILPYVQAGYIVISDRSADSSCAYQGYGRGLSVDMINRINRWVLHDKVPDITMYLHITPERIQERITQRGEEASSFEQEQKAFFERVYAGFEDIFSERDNLIRLDATERPRDVVQHAVAQVLPYVEPLQVDQA